MPYLLFLTGAPVTVTGNAKTCVWYQYNMLPPMARVTRARTYGNGDDDDGDDDDGMPGRASGASGASIRLGHGKSSNDTRAYITAGSRARCCLDPYLVRQRDEDGTVDVID